MAKPIYTAEANVTGGGTNPEQLFAIGYAACFEGALGVVARREKAEVGDAGHPYPSGCHPLITH